MTAMALERRRMLIALGELHDKWVAANLEAASESFDPSGRKEGSDYNQHHVDLDADGGVQDDFDAKALAILRPGATVSRSVLREVVAREVQALLRGDVDDDPIGELDDDTVILIMALDELGQELAGEGRAWNPELHKRWPKGHPKAGKFRPMVDMLKLAIANFDGKGHPFDNFNREQLRKAAKTRGITLKRGEDKDSIAQKLLADLGGTLGKKKTAEKKAPTKKAATPKLKKPVQLTPAQELDRWKADAAKSGRMPVAASGPTKREDYLASWDRAIERIRKEMAEAEANGQKYKLPDLENQLAYNIKAMKAIRESPDPSLDEPVSGSTFVLAQKVDKDRPLAIYGDVLHMEGSDEAWLHLNLKELERVPAELHAIVAAHMAAKADGGIWIGDTGVSRMNHSHDLGGETPRGWSDGKTFDDVNGVFRPDRRIMLVGRTANSAARGDKTASHEFGHALDFALGHLSGADDWAEIHKKALGDQISPYYRQSGQAGREEFWAEAFSAWVTARQQRPGFDTTAKYIIRLDVSGDTGKLIHEYFDRFAKKWGVA